ncbi:hypothetical protein M9434_005586 [Picochlorum sp. BPE23]|nr:hypothetical protein M9434_005586 [Picochlorum sp. BPE23]
MQRSIRLQDFVESRSRKRHKQEEGALASTGPHPHTAFDVFNTVGEDIMRHLPMSSQESEQVSGRDMIDHVQTLLQLQRLGLVGTAQIRSHLMHHCGYSLEEFLQEDEMRTVAQLKALCRTAGVSTSGNKAALLDRLGPTVTIPASLYRKVVEQVKMERLNKIKRIAREGMIDDGRHPLWIEHILASTDACYSMYKRRMVGKPFNLPQSIISEIKFKASRIRTGVWYQWVHLYRPSFVLYVASLLFDEGKMATVMESINTRQEIMDEIRTEDTMRVQIQNSMAQISEIWDQEGWSGLNLLHEQPPEFAKIYPHTYARLAYVQNNGEESIRKANSLMERAIASRRMMQELESRHGVIGLTEASVYIVSDMIDRAMSVQEMWMQRGFDDVDVLDISVILYAFNAARQGEEHVHGPSIPEHRQGESRDRASKLSEKYSITCDYVLIGIRDDHMQIRTFLHEQQQCMDAESYLQMTERIAEKVIFGRSLLKVMRHEWQKFDLPGGDFLTAENLFQYVLDVPAFVNTLPRCEEAWENGLPSYQCFLKRFFFLFDVCAQGHVIGDDVVAVEPVPAFRASIKDGYAVVAGDGPGRYPVVFEAHAGGDANAVLCSGQVAYIGTGGPVPDGADAVVQIEDTKMTDAVEGDDSIVEILREVKPGEDIRDVGSDMRPGEVVMQKGEYIGAGEIAMLATVGVREVPVYRKPTVAIMSTGDEVEEPTIDSLPRGKVRDANRAMLVSAASASGARALDMGIARDTEENIEKALDEAMSLGADIIITTGGVSMGTKDFIKPLLERRGTIHFGKIRMKPGKPCTFATISHDNTRDTVVFGLPGNPVSALTTFHLLVSPCIRRMGGYPDHDLILRAHARTTFPITMDPVRVEYRRVHVVFEPSSDANGTLVAYPVDGSQISSRIMSFREANGLLIVPQKKGEIPAGSILPMIILHHRVDSLFSRGNLDKMAL